MAGAGMTEKIVHYGLWHPERGWWWSYMTVWTTTHHQIALAQCEMVQRGAIGLNVPDNRWRIRPLLNWSIKLSTEEHQALEWQDD